MLTLRCECQSQKPIKHNNMMTMKQYVLSFLLLFAVLSADAQVSRWFRRYAKAPSESALVQQYADSLSYYKAQLEQLQQQNEQLMAQQGYLTGNPYLYRLFAPPTFYHDVAAQQLTLDLDGEGHDVDVDGQAANDALMAIYLDRPDLVVNSEKRLQAVGTVNAEVDDPVVQTVELVEKVDDVPQEPQEEAPVEVMVTKPNFWTFKGDYYLQFLQNYISGNWYKGGESNYSLLASATIEANYNNKQKVKWDNKLETKIGFLTSKGDSLHTFKTSEDLIRLTSNLGLQATKHWYYTLQLIAWTQFARGFKNNDERIYSDFFSPFKLNLSLGMDYNVEAFNKKLTGKVHLAPLAYNFQFVGRRDLQPTFGHKEGQYSMHDIGSQVLAELEWVFSDNIKWKTRFFAFTSYKRVEMEWENTFTLQVSKYISANLFLYPRFDDSAVSDSDYGYWQFKEYSSIGFSYTF